MEYSTGIIFLISLLAAAVPAGLYVALIYWVDHYEKEPAWLLAATFFWGAVPAILLAIILNVAGSLPFYLLAGPDVADAVGAIFIAPPVEETVKAIALLGVFLLLRHEVDGLLDGIIYGAMVGMGFAMVENVFYFMSVYGEAGVEAWRTNIFFRAILFGLNHSLFTSMTGLGLAIGRFTSNRPLRLLAPIAGWSAATFLHAVHNLGASLGGPFCLILPFTDWGGVALVAVIIVWALWQEKRWIRSYLKEEVARGTITLRQYQRASSGRARLRHCVDILINRGLRDYRRAVRFYHHCSELAYKKHHYTLLQEPKSEELTRQLRNKLTHLSRQI